MKFHGDIWGEMPADFPTQKLEAAYRQRINIIGPQSRLQKLIGMGLKGVAYRFRAVNDYSEAFKASLQEHGIAPKVDVDYQHERMLFGFFMSGFSCIESFFFSVHALGAYYSKTDFGISNDDLQGVNPKKVTEKYEKLWPHYGLTISMRSLIGSPEYGRWKKIRNVITHRAVPPSLISVNVGEKSVEVTWQVEEAGAQEANEPINELTMDEKRFWLSTQIERLVDGFSAFYPASTK